MYGWVERTLVRHEYASSTGRARELVRRYLARMTGLSRAQVTRLIARYRQDRARKAVDVSAARFPKRYTRADMRLLASWTRRTGTSAVRPPSGFWSATTATMAKPSSSAWRPSRWRSSTGCATGAYRQRNTTYQPTRPTVIPSASGASRSRTAGRDTCGSTPCIKATRTERKGLYHINAVDEVTQWEIVAATAQICEPGCCRCWKRCWSSSRSGFAASIPTTAASSSTTAWPSLLDKLLIEQTKSRAQHSGDNGLVESKNGAVIRKHIGYGHIAAQHAEAIDSSTASISIRT